jgi:hypothetical protein
MPHDTPSTEPIDDSTVEEIANAADADKRSVVRRLARLPVKGRAGRRIDRILAARGLLQSEAAPSE